MNRGECDATTTTMTPQFTTQAETTPAMPTTTEEITTTMAAPLTTTKSPTAAPTKHPIELQMTTKAPSTFKTSVITEPGFSTTPRISIFPTGSTVPGTTSGTTPITRAHSHTGGSGTGSSSFSLSSNPLLFIIAAIVVIILLAICLCYFMKRRKSVQVGFGEQVPSNDNDQIEMHDTQMTNEIYFEESDHEEGPSGRGTNGPLPINGATTETNNVGIAVPAAIKTKKNEKTKKISGETKKGSYEQLR